MSSNAGIDTRVDMSVNEMNIASPSLDEENHVTAPTQNGDEDLPIVSQVKPLQELLDQVQELEEKQQNIPGAKPLDPEEVINSQKLQQCRQWIFMVGACVLAVLCFGSSVFWQFCA
jgi:hypothetical protein